MSRAPHFEVVHADTGWHARFVAANGQTVWVTESYTRKRAARNAIESVVAPCYGWVEDDAVVCLSSRDSWNKVNRPVAAIRLVDERSAS